MTALSLPNTIDVNTTADAVEVEQNFNVIQSYVNTDVIRRDGGVAMQAPLVLNADPTQDEHAANKNYVDALMPIGTIMMFGGNIAPAGDWHLCDGTSLTVASYPVLYGQLGVRYGGSGGTFKLPNFAARMPIGRDASQTRFDATGKTGGNTVGADRLAHPHDQPRSRIAQPHPHDQYRIGIRAPTARHRGNQLGQRTRNRSAGNDLQRRRLDQSPDRGTDVGRSLAPRFRQHRIDSCQPAHLQRGFGGVREEDQPQLGDQRDTHRSDRRDNHRTHPTVRCRPVHHQG